MADIGALLDIVGKIQHDQWHMMGESPPGDGPTSDVRDLAGKQKDISPERLGELLGALFPGKSVTVTDASGETLFGEVADIEDEPTEETKERG